MTLSHMKIFFELVTFFVTSFAENVTFWHCWYKTFLNGKKCDDSAGTEKYFCLPVSDLSILGSVKREREAGRPFGLRQTLQKFSPPPPYWHPNKWQRDPTFPKTKTSSTKTFSFFYSFFLLWVEFFYWKLIVGIQRTRGWINPAKPWEFPSLEHPSVGSTSLPPRPFQGT